MFCDKENTRRRGGSRNFERGCTTIDISGEVVSAKRAKILLINIHLFMKTSFR